MWVTLKRGTPYGDEVQFGIGEGMGPRLKAGEPIQVADELLDALKHDPNLEITAEHPGRHEYEEDAPDK